MTTTKPPPPVLPGVALTERYLDEHDLSRAELARRASRHSKVDRVTLVNILEGHITRVSAAVAVALEKATDGAVPVEAWVLLHEAANDNAAASPSAAG